MKYTILIDTDKSKKEVEAQLADFKIDYIVAGNDTSHGYFSTTRFDEDAIKAVLESRDVPVTEKNIQTLLDYAGQLDDMMSHDGYENLGALLEDAQYEGAFEEN